ncbi:3-phosphoshikimate 1-carboxyvinyltransferase [Zhouia amylolytica]|uniref:3-phosphoshikimate 1-carboxyvinyltransferase n=1 Tax=Zhouia amylolytica TaxID=376730 RepID=A0A1I6RHW3_9FLAO|nr:3-phosphoshikimate 1-carboxyvinyltransferase [Zhouia amylolytica]MCQ0110599.1 3-phosphoshikimate 1-carboxyvinyltransferase [Zhouia amylolytica]SFS64255.1 3-phosphoshikimate 1-carboxyvinyltransferase [Zhouia amylolytica]
MNLHLHSSVTKLIENIEITGSKSESNRALLLQALYPALHIENISNSDDSEVMQKGLKILNGEVDIHHAGTAMRFLTTFFATQEGREVVLTGSQRMKERPIRILVDALKQLNASIEYTDNDGYPPLKIVGKNLSANKVTMAANVSSQYISSILLSAPFLQNGIILELEGKITSVPYINMTLGLLSQIGVTSTFEGNVIKVEPIADIEKAKTIVVESDWSSASYFYSIIALCDVGSTIKLSSYKKDSLQGDSVLTEIYKDFGVATTFEDNTISITKERAVARDTSIQIDLSNAPDIAQTIAVTSFGLGIACDLSGLHTLKIKETDRLEALKAELGKLGAEIEVTDKELHLKPSDYINPDIAIDTYNDHRMAMAFAPLALKTSIIINDAEVVSKSYPDFWNDMKKLHFNLKEL